jgi:hypothetical protein
VLLCGETRTCTRPSDTTLSAPYLGALGQEGCAVNARCDVEIGNNQGKCKAQGCLKEPGDPVVPAKVNGSTMCNAPLDFSFEGKPSEVYRFGATMSVLPGAAAGANVAATLMFGGVPVIESLNNVGFDGAPYPGQPVVGERWYSIREAGTYTLRFSVEQCDIPVDVQGSIERMGDADPNLTTGTAAPLAAGVNTSGTLNCEEERWFILTPAAGQTLRFTLSGMSLLKGTSGGAQATVLDSSLQPLNESGEAVAVDAAFGADPPATLATRDVLFPGGGLHYVRLGFPNGCAISTYQLSATTP